MNGEGRYLAQLGDLPGAVAVSETLLDVAEQASRRDPEDSWSRMAVAVAAGALGEALLNVGHGRESERRFRQALNIADRAVAEDPQNSYSRLQAASAQYGLGRTLVSQPTFGARTEGCALLHRVQTFWADLQTRRELPANELADSGTLHRFLNEFPSGS